MSFFPFADAATAAVSPLSRRRNNHHRHRRTRKDDYDPYLGLAWGRQIDVDQSLSVKSKSPSRSPSPPIEFNHENIDWFNGLTSQPSPPPEKVDAPSSRSHSMSLSMPSQSISMSMSSPSRSMPISTPTYTPNDAGLVKEPTEDSSTDEVSGGLQVGLVVAVVFIVAMCIAFLTIRRRNVVKQHRLNEQESDSDDDSKETDEASAKERDPEGGSKSDEFKQESKSADSKKIGVFNVDTSCSWIPSSDSSGSNIKEPIFIPAISSDEEIDYKSTNEDHPEEKEEHEDEEKLDISDGIQPIVRRISQLDATTEPNEIKDSDHVEQAENPALDIKEVTRVERALLDEILTGMQNSPDRAAKTPENSPDRSAMADASRANNEKTEVWREEFRRDIRSGLARMTSIHQQMLDQQAMLQAQAPAEIRNKYYSVISRTAIQRAELESKKIELETKRAELELKTLDLELRKIEVEEKSLANTVSSSEESDIDQRDRNDNDDVDISISEIKEG